MYGYIYKTANLVNNKIYIGQHKSAEFNPKYLGSGVLIRRAIKEFGKDNFKVELIEECADADELNLREEYYIKQYNARDLTIGYNIANGGQERFFTGCTHSDEARLKMSNRAKNRPHPPTTLGRIQITNGIENHTIKENEFPIWQQKGFYRGRVVTNKVVWNKGLTKETNAKVRKCAERRAEKFANGESIGCFGIKGNTNGFKKGGTPWNKGLKGYNKGHPNYYLGKNKK